MKIWICWGDLGVQQLRKNISYLSLWDWELQNEYVNMLGEFRNEFQMKNNEQICELRVWMQPDNCELRWRLSTFNRGHTFLVWCTRRFGNYYGDITTWVWEEVFLIEEWQKSELRYRNSKFASIVWKWSYRKESCNYYSLLGMEINYWNWEN